MMTKNKEIIIDGLRIEYLQRGILQDCPIVCLPGWMAEANLYKDAMGDAENFLILNWPGFGKSQQPNSVWGIEEYATFLQKLLKELKIEKCSLVGYSFGGSVAIYFSAKYPQKIKKLILVASSGIRNKGFLKKIRKIIFLLLSKIVKIFLIIFPQNIKQNFRKKLYKIIGSEDYIESGGMKESYRKTIERDLQEEMQKINCPTFLIWGEKDKSVPVKEAYQTQKNIKNSKLEIIKNVGHYPFLNNKKEWQKIFKDIID